MIVGLVRGLALVPWAANDLALGLHLSGARRRRSVGNGRFEMLADGDLGA
jgi:hypothetical protein